MLLVIGLIAAALLLAWGGMEFDSFYRAYPLQFWFGVASFLVLSFALAAARFRKANERVPLRPAPPALPPAVAVKPLAAAPTLRAIASPGDDEAAGCEGPGCANKVDDDPWRAKVPGEPERLFCSEACTREWQQARAPRPLPR